LFDAAGEFDHTVGEMEGALGEFWFELLDGLKDDFHVFDDVVAGDDDGFIEFIVVPFGEDEADVFGFVGGEAVFVDEDAGVEAVGFATEDDGAFAFFVDSPALLLENSSEAELGGF